jgi:uncharacterized glyoxalase superfamily protein PhnB
MKPTLWPSLGYQDAPAALRFLVGVFGFEEVAIYYGEPDGWIDQAVLRWRDGGIITIHSTGPDTVPFADLRRRAPIGIYLYTPDPDALYEKALAAGATADGPPRDSPHGARDATVADPEGFLWSFGTYRGD